MDKIPTYLIHGSLGSGKTTLLNKLLKSDAFKDSIVIENEYADYNFDRRIIGSEAAEIKVFGVSGGCICCSPGQELFDALRSVSKEKRPGNLFIETTGVASSVQLIKQLMLSSDFDGHYSLVRNVFVLDMLEDSLESVKERKMLDIAMADVIILNKADLVPESKAEAFKSAIKGISDALIIATSYGDADPNLIRSDAKSKADAVLLDNIGTIENYFIDHSKDVLYQVIYPSKRISGPALTGAIAAARNDSSMDIARIKGTFTGPDGMKMFISGTRNNCEIKPAADDSADNVLILIGKNVTKDNVKDAIGGLCH